MIPISNIVEKIDLAEEVGRLSLKGKNPNQIAAELGVERRHVTQALKDFKALLRQNAETALDVRERLLDIIYESDEAFKQVIDEAWKVSEEAEQNGSLSVKIQALNLIKSTVKERSGLLIESGASQDSEVASQIAEQEERHEVLIGILKEIRDEHPEVAELIGRRLTKIQGDVEVIETTRAIEEHAGT